MPVWPIAFAVSILVTLVVTPLSRRLALTTNLVDKPGQHKSHIRPTPYLGGIGLITSVLIGLGLDARANPRVAAVALGGALIGILGLLDDDRTVDPRLRFLAELAVAAVVISFGLRIHASGIVPIDVVLTLLWLVGVTNAFNLLDNMDGLAAGTAAAAAAAVFALAIMGIQPVVATTAAAVVGACLAFLAYNRPPASIFMGDAGSLFLGFVLAVLTISVNPALDPPFSFAVPLILLALPVLDTSTVTIARLRRGLAVSSGGKDHLSHRLVALGLSRGRAVAVLVGVEATLGVVAILAGRRVLQLRWTILAAVVLLAALAGVTARATVYVQPVVGLPRRLRLAACAVVGGTLVLAAPATLALMRAVSGMWDAVRTVESALDSFSGSDTARIAKEFERSEALFAAAERKLDGPWVSLGLAVPVLSSNVRASRTLASAGQDVSAAGADTVGIADGGTIPVSSGSVGLDELSRFATALSKAADTLERSHQRLASIERSFLVPSLRRAVLETDRRLTSAGATLAGTATLARYVPPILGSTGARHYLLVFQNDHELRATGGVIHSWAELRAENGRLHVERTGSRQELDNAISGDGAGQDSAWSEVNTSPDFPTSARRIGDLYSRSGGRPVDGVIALDSTGLVALLELAGPVPVHGWPNSVGSHNLDEVIRSDAADAPTRESGVVGQVLVSALHAVTTRDLGTARNVVRLLSRGTQDQHLLLYLSRPEEERAISGIGVDGAVEPVLGDSLLVVGASAWSDWGSDDVRRRVRYDVSLRPGMSAAELSGRLEVGTTEGTSGQARDLPSDISVFSPFDAVSASLGGASVELRTRSNLGRQEHSMHLPAAADRHRTLTMEVRGRLALTNDGWYRLDVQRQPSVPQDVDVSVTVPRGWRIAEAHGLRKTAERRAFASIHDAEDGPILVRLERTGIGRVWDRLTRS